MKVTLCMTVQRCSDSPVRQCGWWQSAHGCGGICVGAAVLELLGPQKDDCVPLGHLGKPLPLPVNTNNGMMRPSSISVPKNLR